MVNTTLLNDRIKQSGKKKAYLADRCGISRQALRNKCNNKSDFYANEINVLCTELGIVTLVEKEKIFFA